MSTTYSANLALPTPAPGDLDWAPTLLALFAILDALAPLAAGSVIQTETPSTTLRVNVRPCSYRRSTGAFGSYAGVTNYAVPASSTTCLYLTDAGSLASAAGSFPTGSPIVRLATVVAGASSITSITDARVVLGVGT